MAGLAVLVAVAKADGVIAPEERQALEAALDDTAARSEGNLAPLPGAVDKLLDTTPSIDVALGIIVSQALREQVFAAAVTMAHADRTVAPEEDKLLRKIKSAWSISDRFAAEAHRVAALASMPPPPEGEPPAQQEAPKAPLDPAKIDAEAKRLIYGYAVLSISLGAFPIPGVSIIADVAVLIIQRGLIARVARAHGKELTKNEVAATFGAMVGLAAVRVAVVSLMKLVPVWGWVVGGATSFIATWAVGMAVHKNLARGGNLSPEELKADYQAAKEDAAKVFKSNKAAIEKDAKAQAEAASALAKDLHEGKISQDDLERTASDMPLPGGQS